MLFRTLVCALLISLASSLSAYAQSQPAQTKKTTTTKTSKPASKLLDLNSATKEELAALPGVGDTCAQKIIDHRPYKTKADLTRKKVLPQAVYKKIASKVTAKAPAPAKPAAAQPAKPATPAEPAKPAAAAEPAKTPAAPASSKPAAAAAPPAPATAKPKATPPSKPIVLKGAPMGGVKFEHAKHPVSCDNCHHPSREPKPGTAPQAACTSCHTSPPPAGMKTGKQAAFHNPTAAAGTCIDCHKKSGGNAPTKCMQCHKKENS